MVDTVVVISGHSRGRYWVAGLNMRYFITSPVDLTVGCTYTIMTESYNPPYKVVTIEPVV